MLLEQYLLYFCEVYEADSAADATAVEREYSLRAGRVEFFDEERVIFLNDIANIYEERLLE